MAARTSMTDLIARLRVMVGDTAGSPTFTDNDLQDALDERRTDVVEAALRYRPSTGPTALLFTDWFAPRRWWEDSVVLSGAGGNTLTPDSSDLIAGHWIFTAGTAVPVYITGAFYDMNGTAAAVCQQWAAAVARDFDFGTDQQQFDRTGKREGLLAVAAEFQRNAIQPGRRPAWRSMAW